MMENQAILNQYNEEEIKQLLNSDEKLVYIDNGSEEFVARYEDVPDIIVDINDKIGSINLTERDVVRHALVQRIIVAYDKYDKKQEL